MKKLIKQKRDIEYGIEQIISQYQKMNQIINTTSATNLDETERRLKMIHRRDELDMVLRYLDIQSFELDKEYNTIEII